MGIEWTQGSDAGGDYWEGYDEDAGLYTRWYGREQPREEEVVWYPLPSWGDVDPFDLACERRHD
jgi:hypothetical protein